MRLPIIAAASLLVLPAHAQPQASQPASASLLEGDWTIEAVGGRPVARGTTPAVAFHDARISGNASCNRFSGSFRFERGHLTTGPLGTTRMACVQRAQNLQERTVLRVLGKRLRVSRNRSGTLVLTSPQGETLRLVRRESGTDRHPAQ